MIYGEQILISKSEIERSITGDLIERLKAELIKRVAHRFINGGCFKFEFNLQDEIDKLRPHLPATRLLLTLEITELDET